MVDVRRLRPMERVGPPGAQVPSGTIPLFVCRDVSLGVLTMSEYLSLCLALVRLTLSFGKSLQTPTE